MAEYVLEEYHGGGAREKFSRGDSPFLVSSSPWLNDPRMRDLVAKHSLRRNHVDVPPTFDITDFMPVISESWPSRIALIEELFVAERRKNKALDAWFEERHISNFTLEGLKEYPFNSVGNLFYRFLIANDYVPEFKPENKSTLNFEYFQKRLSQQHDLEHLLGGFGFDYLGEQAVTWMRHFAYFKHLSPKLAGILNETYAFLMTPQLMRTQLHYPEAVLAMWDGMDRGKRVGFESEPIFLMKYEPVMHLPLEEARKVLGYRGVTEWPHHEIAQEWAEGVKGARDPRRGDDLPIAAE